MKTKTNSYVRFFSLLSIILFAVSCKVGLGGAVDTTTPTITITSPEVSSVLAEGIRVKGTAADDTGLKKVAVNLRGLDDGSSTVKEATVDLATGEWECTFITKRSATEAGHPDGNYEIVATATDIDGKTSTVTNAVIIDNTPPTVIVNKPALYNQDRSTAFIRADIVGDAEDANSIKSVKVYLCKYDSIIDSTDLARSATGEGTLPSTVKEFEADGTKTWNFSKELDSGDLATFFENNEEYSFWVVAEDVAGNKNEFFYRKDDFYGILTPSTDPNKTVMPPTSAQIGEIIRGKLIGSDEKTAGVTAEKLETIKIPVGNQYQSGKTRNEQDLVSFNFKKESEASVEWQNITPEQPTLPLDTAIIGTIKSTDTSSVIRSSVKFFITNRAAPEPRPTWELQIQDKDSGGKDDLKTVGDSVSFTVYPKPAIPTESFKSGNYSIRVEYRTKASEDKQEPLTDAIDFGVSAGTPKLEETAMFHALNPDDSVKSPTSLEGYFNDTFELIGIARRGDGEPALKELLSILLNNNNYEIPTIGNNGEWTIPVTTEGENRFEFVIEDGGIKVPLYRTIIIDKTKPIITINELQSADGNSVTLAGTLTEDNPNTLEYAFVKKDTTPQATDWKTPSGVNNWKATIDTSNASTYPDGTYTLHVKAVDKAGNETTETKDLVLDRQNPVINLSCFEAFSNYLKAGDNKAFLKAEPNTDVATDNYALDKIELKATNPNGGVETWFTKDGISDSTRTTTVKIGELTGFPTFVVNDKIEGRWQFTLEVTDQSGKVASTRFLDFTSDKTKPTIAITGYPTTSSNVSGNEYEFKGTANDTGSAVSKVRVSLVQNEWKEENTFDSGKSWTKTLTLPQGTGTIYAQAYDEAGNISEIVSQNFTFDSEKPTLTLTGDVQTDKNISQKFSLAGNIADTWALDETTPITITQQKDSGTPKAISVTPTGDAKAKTWTVENLPRSESNTANYELATGIYKYTITAKDKSGKTETKIITITVDKEPPAVPTIKLPADGTSVTKAMFNFETSDVGTGATGVDRFEYFLSSTSLSTTALNAKPISDFTSKKSSGEFSEPQNFEEGKYYLYVRAVDKAENKSAFATSEFTYDIAAPEIRFPGSNTVSKAKNYYLFRGSVYDSNALPDASVKIIQKDSAGNEKDVRVTINKTDNQNATWEPETLPLTVGNIVNLDDYNDTYEYIITVTDICGKTQETKCHYTLDTIAPQIEVRNLSEGDSLSTNNFTLQGSVQDLNGVQGLYYAFDKLNPGNSDLNGWTFVEPKLSFEIPLENLKDGQHQIHLFAIDTIGGLNGSIPQGNRSKVKTINFSTDATPPNLTLSQSGNNYTSSTFALNGTAIDSVGLKELKINVGTTTVATITEFANDGAWSYTLTEANLTESQMQTVTVVASDKAGNATTKTVNVYLDKSAPEVIIKNLANDQHITETDFTSGKFKLSGSWQDNGGSGIAGESAKLEYRINGSGTDAWTTIANSTVNFTQELTLTENLNTTLEIRATDKVGNSAITEITGIVVDTSAPVAGTTTTNSTVVAANGSYTLSGTATDTLALDRIVVQAKHNSGAVTEWYTKTATGNNETSLAWSKALEITEANQGDWTFTIKAYDKSGRESVVETRTVFVDIKLPQATCGITTPGNNNWYNNTTLTVEGSAQDNLGIKTIEYKIDDGNYVECNYELKDSVYKYTAKPSFDGEVIGKTVYIRVTDNAGNEIVQSIGNINIDTNNPTVEVTYPTDKPLLNGENDLTIEVTATDTGSGINYVKAKINDKDFSTGTISGSLKAGETNVYTLTIPASSIPTSPTEGTIYIQAMDNATGISETTMRYTIDTTSPTIAITSHSSAEKVNKTITVSGTAGDSQGLAKVELFANNSSIYSTTTNPYVWSTTIDTTAYTGTLTLKAVATDEAGNTAEVSVSVTVDQNSDRPIIHLTDVETTGSFYLNNTSTFNGTIEDDDGVATLKISQDGTEWNDVTIKNGVSWSYTLTQTDGGKVNGDQTIYFKVKDKAGTTFETNAATSLQKPYITDDVRTPIDTVLEFKVDQSRPEIATNEIRIFYESVNPTTLTQAQFEAAAIFANNQKLGGTQTPFYLAIKATDTNGIRSVNAYFTESNKIAATKATNVANTFVTGAIDVSGTSGIADGSQTLTIMAIDNAGNDSNVQKSIIVDNTVPTASIISHNSNDQVTADVVLRGDSTDNHTVAGNPVETSGVAKVSYMIPKKSEAALVNALSTGWIDTTGVASWYIEFTSEYANQLKNYANTTYAKEVGAGIWAVPIYLRIEDNSGNVNIQKDFVLNVDPEGDRPKTKIVDPINNADLGGTIRLFGTAEDNVRVSEVYVQLDINHDGSFTDADKTLLTSADAQYAGYKDKVVDFTDATGTPTWGIKVDGTTTWNFTINQNGELNQNDKTTYKIRACAKDNNDLFGLWTEEVTFTVDKNSPKFGDASNPLKLVQFANNAAGTGDIVASKDYVAGEWINGKWWLTTKVYDDNGITSLYINDSNIAGLNGHIVQNGTTLIAADIAETENVGSNKNYTIKIPLDTTTFPSNSTEISFKLNAEDGDSPAKSGMYPISLNYDNTAPLMEKLTNSEGKEFGNGNNGTAIIEQSNYSVEFSAIATDGGSGFDRALVYFKRGPTTASGADAVSRIYMPQEAKGTNRTDLAAAAGENKLAIVDDLPKLNVTGTLAQSTFTSASLKNNKNIRVGGLVTILGVDRKITSVENRDSTGEISFSPMIDTGTGANKTVSFIYALVVDNFTVETPKRDKHGNVSSIIGDDGDGVVESIQKSGGSYTWSVSIDSKNIPDGPLSICVVAYDKSGNKTALQETETSVMNNRPRIAKIFLGTDLDGNGSISEAEETVFANPEIFSPDGEFLSEIDLDATGTDPRNSRFKAVGKTHIRPEITGGNGDLYYYGFKRTGEIAAAGDALSTAKGTLRTGDDTTGTINPIMLNYANDAIEGFTDTTGGQFFFKIFDSTEGLTTNSANMADNTSQWATMAVSMAIDVVDEVAPVAVIDNFYWNSATDNSLFENSRNNGHIELEADLPAAFTAGGTGVNDRDPKVSGKISIRGSAYDDIRLTALYLRFDDFTFTGITGGANTRTGTNGTYYKLATYADGTWTGTGNATLTNGWQFTVTNEYQGQTGHKVNWQLDIDTSRITNVAGVDKTVRIIALDGRSTPNASAETASTAMNEAGTELDTSDTVYNKPSYKMDVVPYVTGVSTSLDSLKKNNPTVYSRTAQGHYPVRSNETVILKGFNLVANSSTVNLAMTNKTSGTYNYSVNGIEILNNINNNNACGSYGLEAENYYTDSNFAYCYNRQPNGDNNYYLTDDIIFDVWEFDNTNVATVYDSGYIQQPVMKINPYNNMIGFAFANGAAYASLPNRTTSASLWQRNYARNTGTAFAYDTQGYAHGITVGLDTNPNDSHAGRLTYINSRWGADTGSQEGNYRGNNKLRLEAIGAPAGTYAGKTYDSAVILEERFPSISLTTATHGTTPTVYLAYYDDLNQYIRFRYGDNPGNAKKTFNQFTDQTVNSNVVFEPTAANYSVVASTTTTYKAGEHVCISVIPGNTKENDVVVIVWYDATNNALMYSYKKNPCTDNDGGTNEGQDGYWAAPKVIAEQAGDYCKIAVDVNGGVHIAAYDNANADLIYAYLKNYDSATVQVVTVDSYAITGTELTIDVALDKTGTYIEPYIGYYASSIQRPMLATLKGTILSSGDSTVPNGVDNMNETFTSKWEVSVLPTESRVRNDHINVAVWKDNAGKLKNSVHTANNSYNNGTSYVYGNGTSNPVLGYAIRKATTGYLETAQMK